MTTPETPPAGINAGTPNMWGGVQCFSIVRQEDNRDGNGKASDKRETLAVQE